MHTLCTFKSPRNLGLKIKIFVDRFWKRMINNYHFLTMKFALFNFPNEIIRANVSINANSSAYDRFA